MRNWKELSREEKENITKEYEEKYKKKPYMGHLKCVLLVDIIYDCCVTSSNLIDVENFIGLIITLILCVISVWVLISYIIKKHDWNKDFVKYLEQNNIKK